jgi:4-diphosphocytidyl-2-C-methyl-D-erythritol kinase
MKTERIGDELMVQSPSKVNLFLEILGRRPDGYHDLQTVMQTIDLCDELRIAPCDGDETVFRCDHPKVPNDSSNLVVRAAEVIRRRTGIRSGVRLTLEKRTPVGGGLGAGSANAAATLLGLNEFWHAGLSKADLHPLAAALGSDINFFLEGGTALCTGRGEVVRPVRHGLPMHFVLVLPPFGVSTARAFQEAKDFLTRPHKDATITLKALENNEFGALCEGLFNRFERPVFRLYPELAALKSRMEEVAPGRALLSGSGSTLFCLCRDRIEAEAIEREFQRLKLGSVCRAARLADEMRRPSSPGFRT